MQMRQRWRQVAESEAAYLVLLVVLLGLAVYLTSWFLGRFDDGDECGCTYAPPEAALSADGSLPRVA